MIRRTVHFSGRVQGVGFRYTTCQIAARFPVVGYTKNLPDGRVEVVVEGAASDVERFLSAVAKEMASNIRASEKHESAATNEFRGFDVRF